MSIIASHPHGERNFAWINIYPPPNTALRYISSRGSGDFGLKAPFLVCYDHVLSIHISFKLFKVWTAWLEETLSPRLGFLKPYEYPPSLGIKNQRLCLQHEVTIVTINGVPHKIN